MNVVYSCYGGTHSSPVAAAIHLGILPEHPPNPDDLLKLRYFDRVHPSRIGHITWMGTDIDGHRVFVLGRGSRHTAVINAFFSGYRLNESTGNDGSRGTVADIIVVDTLGTVNISMRIGGFLSRRLGIVGIGRPIVTWGTLKAYRHLVDVVRQTKRQLRNE